MKFICPTSSPPPPPPHLTRSKKAYLLCKGVGVCVCVWGGGGGGGGGSLRSPRPKVELINTLGINQNEIINLDMIIYDIV